MPKPVYKNFALTLALLLVGTMAGRALAGEDETAVLGLIPTGGLVETTTSLRKEVGSKFSVAEPLRITSLGYFDADMDGFVAPHTVKLWTDGGSLIRTVVVSSASRLVGGSFLGGGFRFESVDVTLQPGTYRISGGLNLDSRRFFADGVLYDNGGAPPDSARGVTYVTRVYSTRSADAGAFPSLSGTGRSSTDWFGPNFLVGPAEKIPTTVKIVSITPTPSPSGGSVQVDFEVGFDAATSEVPSGTVTITSPHSDPVTIGLPSGRGSVVMGSSGATGLTVRYSGDENFDGSTALGDHLVLPIVGISIAGVSDVIEDGDARIEVVVSRVGDLGQPLVVPLSFDRMIDGFEAPESVTILAGEESASISIDPVDDNLVEEEERFTVAVVRSDDDYFIDGEHSAVSGGVIDDDYPPTAVADAYEVVEDGVMVVGVGAGILANDTDLDDGDGPGNLTGIIREPPSHGTLVSAPDGSFTYTPERDYFGEDRFVYSAMDGTNSSVPVGVLIRINELVGLGVRSTESLDPVIAGHAIAGSVDHVLTVSNSGPSDATGISVDVRSSLPDGVTATRLAGAIVDGQWVVPTLAEGDSVSLIIRYSASATSLGGSGSIVTAGSIAGVDQPLVLMSPGGAPGSSITTSIISPASLQLAVITPDPSVDRQSGLFAQRLQITNTNPLAISGFRLLVSGIPEAMSVYNATGSTAAGVPFLSYPQELGAGASVTVTVEFYGADRTFSILPTYSLALLADGEDAPPTHVGVGLQVDRVEMLADGSLLIEWGAEAGASYSVEYSSDTKIWKSAPPNITASTNRVQWIDNGPPKTDRPRADVGSRYYRVMKVAEPGISAGK